MPDPIEIPRSVLLRDVLIFHAKLWMDGLKDIILGPLSLMAAVFDIIFGPRARGYRFYSLLRVGERFDLWLNLFGPAERARDSREGLFGGSEPGDATFTGTLEQLAQSGRASRPR